MGCQLCKFQSDLNSSTEDQVNHVDYCESHEKVVEVILHRRKKLPPIYADDIDVGLAEKSISGSKSKEDLEFIESALSKHSLFALLDHSLRQEIAAQMDIETISPSTLVVEQNQPGDRFYIVNSGSFQVIVDEQNVATLSRGKIFGEIAMFYHGVRNATVQANMQSSVFSIARQSFRQAVATLSINNIAHNLEALRKVPLFMGLTEDQLHAVSLAVQTLHFSANDVIIKKGEIGNVLYIIESGNVNCTNIGTCETKDVQLEQGEYFGERSLLLEEPRAADVIAITNTRILALDRESFLQILGSLQEVLDHNLMLNAIKAVPLFSSLSVTEKKELAFAFESKHFKANEIIVNEDDSSHLFYIIASGEVQVHSSDNPTVFGAGNHFCDQALTMTKVRHEKVVALKDTRCFVISKAIFEQHLGPLAQLMEREASAKRKSYDDEQFCATIKVQDLEFISDIGIGTFGVVKIARHNSTKRFFAVKIMWKEHVVRSGQFEHVKSERSILEKINSPFLLHFYKCLQDESRVYFITELLLGGELFQRIVSKHGHPTPLSTVEAQFYASCTLLALESLHENSIVYRDLKPENILLDDTGYVRLVDFGFSKQIQQRTYTLCGTPEYMAPEMILGTGHGFAVDIWALGIIIYEMIFGDSPFSDENDNYITVCNNILKQPVHFPVQFDPSTKSIVNLLLQKDESQRLGSGTRGILDIKDHNYFTSIPWTMLKNKKIQPLWLPHLSTSTDTRYYTPIASEQLLAIQDLPGSPRTNASIWESF